MYARSAFAATVLLSFASSGPAAEPPEVSFDVGRSIACREVPSAEVPSAEVPSAEVPSAEAALADPGEKMIEVKFRVSTLLTNGQAKDVDELLIVITSPEGRLRAVDFRPRTQMVTDVEGPIETLQTEDATGSFDAHLGGVANAGQGLLDLQLRPNLGGGLTKGNSLKETLKRRAPKTLKVASGTVDGRTGVFFKLKRDTQSTLEGAKDYSCRFAVPQDWQADRAVVSCFARAEFRECFVKRMHLCGNAEFSVGLYLEGDLQGKQLAASLAESYRTPSGNRRLRFFQESLELIKDRLCCN